MGSCHNKSLVRQKKTSDQKPEVSNVNTVHEEIKNPYLHQSESVTYGQQNRKQRSLPFPQKSTIDRKITVFLKLEQEDPNPLFLKLKPQTNLRDIREQINLKYEKCFSTTMNPKDIIPIQNQEKKKISEFASNEENRKAFLYLLLNYKKYGNGEYHGRLEQSIRHGKGTFYFCDGSRYEGHWQKDMMDGKGILYCKDGSRYEGHWKKDMMDGKCTYFRSDGTKQFQAQFSKGRKHGQQTFYAGNGDKIQAYYINNKKISEDHIMAEKQQIQQLNLKSLNYL